MGKAKTERRLKDNEAQAVARTIRGILADYQATEAEAVSAFQAPSRSTGGR